MDYNCETVWVFNSAGARFPGGIFRDRETALKWISERQLTGVLTRYPLDISVIDWAEEKGFYRDDRGKNKDPSFIGGFTTASLEHYHFEEGKTD